MLGVAGPFPLRFRAVPTAFTLACPLGVLSAFGIGVASLAAAVAAVLDAGVEEGVEGPLLVLLLDLFSQAFFAGEATAAAADADSAAGFISTACAAFLVTLIPLSSRTCSAHHPRSKGSNTLCVSCGSGSGSGSGVRWCGVCKQ